MKYMQMLFHLLQICRHVPAPGQYWADAASIGPVLAWFWHIMACLKGCCVVSQITLETMVTNGDVI